MLGQKTALPTGFQRAVPAENEPHVLVITTVAGFAPIQTRWFPSDYADLDLDLIADALPLGSHIASVAIDSRRTAQVYYGPRMARGWAS